MKCDRVWKANDPTPTAKEPKKLHKPHRDLGDLRPEQVIPYVDDSPCDTGTLEVGGQ